MVIMESGPIKTNEIPPSSTPAPTAPVDELPPVGQLEEEARKRKEKLKAMRQKIYGEEIIETKKIDLPLPKPAFRSYNPQDNVSFEESKKRKATPVDIETRIEDTLEKAEIKTLLEEVDLTNLAPRKPDWDLKRDVGPKLTKLERKTQRAIAELILDRLKTSSNTDDLAAAVQFSDPKSNSKLVPNRRVDDDDD